MTGKGWARAVVALALVILVLLLVVPPIISIAINMDWISADQVGPFAPSGRAGFRP